MRKWVPEWLAANYFKLDSAFGIKEGTFFSNAFTFSQAKAVLGASPLVVQKTLWELEHNGLLVKRRDAIDSRSKQYQLNSFDSYKQALNVYFKFKRGNFSKLSVEKKIGAADWPHLITGSVAAFYFDNYQSPGKVMDLAVYPDDYGKFMALLTDLDTVVSPLELIESRRAKHYVRLHPLQPEVESVKTTDGVLIEKPEYLVNDLLTHSTRQKVLECIALIATYSKKLDWNNTIQVTKKDGHLPQLDVVIEMINHEAKSSIVSRTVLEQLSVSMKDQPNYYGEPFPQVDDEFQDKMKKLTNLWPLMTQKERKEITHETGALYYYSQKIIRKGFNIHLPRAQVRKVLDDLGVELNA